MLEIKRNAKNSYPRKTNLKKKVQKKVCFRLGKNLVWVNILFFSSHFFFTAFILFFKFPASAMSFFLSKCRFLPILAAQPCHMITSCNKHFSETVQMENRTFWWKIEQIGEKMTCGK